MFSCSTQVGLCYRRRICCVLHEIAPWRFGISRWKCMHSLIQHGRTASPKANQNCMDASLVTTWGPKRYQVLLNQFSKTVKAAQSCLISSQKRSTVFLLELAPLAVFSHRKKCRRNLSPLVLAAIPNEVFTKEAMFTTQQPQNIFLRLLTMIWDVVVFTVRFVHVVIAFLPVLCLLPMTYISTSCVIMWRQLLLLTVVHMGPTFIKLGQWASTRRDLFSPEFCNLFSKLHTRATEHTWAVTKSNLEKAFGERWSKVLLMMDENPIGSGCIAQVIYALISYH